jgi:hypothetical protein
MRAILIDPFACAVSEVEYDGSNYRNMYPLLSHETHPVDCFTLCYPDGLAGRDALFVDDNGLLGDPHRFFVIEGYEQPLAGKGLIVGADAEGDSISAETPLSNIRVRYYYLGMGHEAVGDSSQIQARRLFQTTKPWQPLPAPHDNARYGRGRPPCSH